MSGPKTGIFHRLRKRTFGNSGWNVLLGVLAVAVLIGSFSALAITTLNKHDSESFTVNGKTYEWETLENDFDTIEVQGYEGVPLATILEDAGVVDPEDHDYKIVGADGYFKTVTWRDMRSGILTNDDEDRKVVFETKAKAYWVREVVEIEVV
ncbi:MAG: hypothetical protein ACMUHU_02765 [Thermoplasmatota archaeon]